MSDTHVTDTAMLGWLLNHEKRARDVAENPILSGWDKRRRLKRPGYNPGDHRPRPGHFTPLRGFSTHHTFRYAADHLGAVSRRPRADRFRRGDGRGRLVCVREDRQRGLVGRDYGVGWRGQGSRG